MKALTGFKYIICIVAAVSMSACSGKKNGGSGKTGSLKRDSRGTGNDSIVPSSDETPEIVQDEASSAETNNAAPASAQTEAATTVQTPTALLNAPNQNTLANNSKKKQYTITKIDTPVTSANTPVQQTAQVVAIRPQVVATTQGSPSIVAETTSESRAAVATSASGQPSTRASVASASSASASTIGVPAREVVANGPPVALIPSSPLPPVTASNPTKNTNNKIGAPVVSTTTSTLQPVIQVSPDALAAEKACQHLDQNSNADCLNRFVAERMRANFAKEDSQKAKVGQNAEEIALPEEAEISMTQRIQSELIYASRLNEAGRAQLNKVFKDASRKTDRLIHLLKIEKDLTTVVDEAIYANTAQNIESSKMIPTSLGQILFNTDACHIHFFGPCIVVERVLSGRRKIESSYLIGTYISTTGKNLIVKMLIDKEINGKSISVGNTSSIYNYFVVGQTLANLGYGESDEAIAVFTTAHSQTEIDENKTKASP